MHPNPIHREPSGKFAPYRNGTEGHSVWFVSDWLEVVFLHFKVPAEVLQPWIPFELDCREGFAYVSLVSFEMRGLHPAGTGIVGRSLFRPWRHQRLLNLRTYVRCGGEPGIYFIKEWINDRLNAWLGPYLYGLPYCRSHHRCTHCPAAHRWEGHIEDAQTRSVFEYTAEASDDGACRPAESNSLPDFLLERYTAFTERHEVRRVFRIEHAPWRQCPVHVQIHKASLLETTIEWWAQATPCGAQTSPGVHDVRMGAPQRIHGSTPNFCRPQP